MKKAQLIGKSLVFSLIIPFFIFSESLQAAPLQIIDYQIDTTVDLKATPLTTIDPKNTKTGKIIDLNPAPDPGRAVRGTGTLMHPLNPDRATIKYTGQNVLAPTTLESEQYALLPTCPATITCPDINETIPLNPDVCPDYCTRTRIVNPVSGVPPLISTTPAVCPRGYAQVASYNIQREIVHDTSRSPDIYIASLAELQDYREAGWTCRVGMGQNQYVNLCQATPPNLPLNTDVMIGPYAGQYTSYSTFVCFLPQMNTMTTSAGRLQSQGQCLQNEWIDCARYESIRAEELSHGQMLGPPLINYNYIYYHFRCSPPENGLFYTDRYAPVSLVCARVKQEWQQMERPPQAAAQAPLPTVETTPISPGAEAPSGSPVLSPTTQTLQPSGGGGQFLP